MPSGEMVKETSGYRARASKRSRSWVIRGPTLSTRYERGSEYFRTSSELRCVRISRQQSSSTAQELCMHGILCKPGFQKMFTTGPQLFQNVWSSHEYFSEEVPASISLPLFQVEPRASLTYDNTLSNQAMYPMFARLKARMGKVQILRLNSKISPELEGVDACYSRHGPACYSHLFFKYSIKFVSSSFLENILDNR